MPMKCRIYEAGPSSTLLRKILKMTRATSLRKSFYYCGYIYTYIERSAERPDEQCPCNRSCADGNSLAERSGCNHRCDTTPKTAAAEACAVGHSAHAEQIFVRT